MGRIDKSDMVRVLDAFPKQCEEARNIGIYTKISQPITSILVCGVGGSALGGEILKSYLNEHIPVEIRKDYEVPQWINKHTLVFVVSYSGNTEETIACYYEIKKKCCPFVCIASGGKLREIAQKDQTTFIDIPKGIAPRDSLAYQIIPMINILMNSRIIIPNNDVYCLPRILNKTDKDRALEMAKRLVNKIPIILSSRRMECLSKIFKIKINENAKVQCFSNIFPEFNHNEMVGFTNLLSDYYMILIEDKDDHPRIKKRMEVTKELMQKQGIPVLLLKITGENRLARIFSTIHLGSYVSYYLALEYGIDPSPVKMVEDFKEKLRENAR